MLLNDLVTQYFHNIWSESNVAADITVTLVNKVCVSNNCKVFDAVVQNAEHHTVQRTQIDITWHYNINTDLRMFHMLLDSSHI